ncbi:MAG: OmpH family outer membrane protein [Desulfovibrionales bacterium]
MMKKTIMLTLALLLLGSAASLAETKIAIIDMKQVMEQSEPGQKAKNELSSKFEGMKGELEAQQAEIQELQKGIQKQSMVLSQEAKQDKEIEFKRKVRDYQDTLRQYQRNIQQEESKMVSPILEKAVAVIQDFGKQNGYTAVFDTKTSGLMYADEAVDITEKIIVELNRAWREDKQ